MWLFSCEMLHGVHQLAANFVCLLSVDGQAARSGWKGD